MSDVIEKPALNGVNTPTLLATINAVGAQPELAAFKFRARASWVSGTHSRIVVDDFFGAGPGACATRPPTVTDADHPAVLVGADNGPTPVEFLLQGLAACLTAGIGNIAAVRGVKLHSVESVVEGDINLLGLLGLDREVRNGYSGIRASFRIRGDAPPEKLATIVEQSRARSAVYDVLTNGCPVVDRDRRGLTARGRRPPPRRPPPSCSRAPAMPRTDVLIIGAGQAGLAMSRCLAARGIEHVLLERGRVAEAWRSERWDLLRLLTPNWMTRLPGHRYDGPDPDGFMCGRAVAGLLDRYAASFAAPVLAHTPVRALAAVDGGYRAETDAGAWTARAVVVATGACHRARRPAFAAALPRGIVQLDPMSYRRPGDLPAGGVLVVGGSASGLQLAQEIHASGRPVTLAAGRHVRMVRRYRGRDIFAWMDAAGISAERARAMPDLRGGAAAAVDAALGPGADRPGAARRRRRPRHRPRRGRRRREAGAGRRPRRALRRLGRAASPGAGADRRAHRRRPGSRRPRTRRRGRSRRIRRAPARRLDLTAEGIRSVIWATGYARDYGWLRVPVLDAEGEIAHEHAASPRRPGSSCWGCACSAGGRPTSSTASAATPRRSPPPWPASSAPGWRHDHDRDRSPLRRRHRRAPARPARPRRSCSPGPGRGCWWSSRRRPAPTRSPPTR